MSDLISIIMPVFDVEKHLGLFKKAIDSIIKQTYKNWELLIVCDGDFKTTINYVMNVIKKHNDKRIKVFKSSKQYGSGIIRNMAFRYTKGKYITFHDSDDYSVPHRFEKLLEGIGKDNIIASNINVNIIHGKGDEEIKIKKFTGKSFDDLIQLRKVKPPFCLPSCLITADLFKFMGGFEKYKYSTEPTLAIKIAYYKAMRNFSEVKIIEEPLMTYNRHSHSVTTSADLGYTVDKCQNAQRKPLRKAFRDKYLKGEIKKGDDKNKVKKELGIKNNLTKLEDLIRIL